MKEMEKEIENSVPGVDVFTIKDEFVNKTKILEKTMNVEDIVIKNLASCGYHIKRQKYWD